MVWGTTTVGGQLTAQLVLTAAVRGLVLAPPRGQLAKALLARSALKLTVPLGAVAEVGVLSVTVAVQLLGLPTGTIAGMQLTSVLVSCLRAVGRKAVWMPSTLASRLSPAALEWEPTAVGV